MTGYGVRALSSNTLTGGADDSTFFYVQRGKLRCLRTEAGCPKTPARRLPRDPSEEARDYTRALRETEAYALSSGDRKKIERLFGEAKHILSMVRLRLRGLTGAGDEFLLTATVQNLKRLAKHTTRPPPRPVMA